MTPTMFQHPSGQPIRERDEFLSLTDMWRAAGGDTNRAPAEWLRSAQAKDLIEFVQENMGISHVLTREQGRTGGTWAHWQIGLAYAKYLSPAFHVWCNQIIRDHMLTLQQSQLMAPFQPKIAFHDKYVASDETYNLQTAGRICSYRPNAFIARLKQRGYIFVQGGRLQAKAKYLEQKLFVNVIQEDTNGVPRAQLHMTAKGVAHFNKLGV
jgi:phage antirepressor YoqD-like protein